MSIPAPPDDPVEREYRSLVRKLRAARGFCVVVYFVQDPRASRQLRLQLGSMLDTLGRQFVVLAADAPDDLVAATLGGIFEAARESHEVALRPVVWVEAFRDGGNPDWDAQRRLLLMRLNERRSRIEVELTAPLILLLPAHGQHDAASFAPDLWHVRLHSAPLTLGAAGSARGGSLSRGTRAAAVESAESDAAGQTLPREVAYWESIYAAATSDDAGSPEALASLSLRDGFEAVHAWLRTNRPDRAAELATQLVAIARERVAPATGPPRVDPVLAACELAVAIGEQGTAFARLGLLHVAASALAEGVAVARAAGAGAPVGAKGAHVLSALLTSLGEIEMSRQRPHEARVAFEESLALRRLSGTGRSLSQDPGVAALLGRLGDAALAANDLAGARTAYQQSVELWHRASEAGRDAPTLRRSLALAQARLADADWDDGQGELALGAYRESVALLRQVLAAEPDEPETLGALASVQTRIAHVEQAVGRVDPAVAACEEVLALCNRLQALRVDIGPLLSDLVGPLQRLSEAGLSVAGKALDTRREQAVLDAAFATFATSFPDGPGPVPDTTELLAAAARLLAALRGGKAAPK